MKLTLPNLIFATALATLILRIVVHKYLMTSCDDQWGIIIDAGSSGSRAHIFTWKEDRNNDLLLSLKEVSNKKIHPGISSYSTGQLAAQSLAPLLLYSQEIIPKQCWSKTRLELLATAGMRLVDPQKTKQIFTGIQEYLINSPYAFEPKQARVVPGDEEAVFDWLSVNFAKDNFVAKNKFVGVSDLGGASTQISFEVGNGGASKAHPGVRTIQVGAHAHSIYAVSRLHMGLYEAYKNTKTEYENEISGNSFPCQIPGNYHECERLTKQFINHHANKDMSKLGNTAIAPPIKPTVTFYGLDNYAKLANVHFSLTRHPDSRELPPKAFVDPDMASFQTVAKKVCAMNWYELRNLVPRKAAKDRLLQHSCFGLIYIHLLLKEVYKMENNPLIFAHSVGDIDGSWATGAAISSFKKPVSDAQRI
jgi:hypothetical protein